MLPFLRWRGSGPLYFKLSSRRKPGSIRHYAKAKAASATPMDSGFRRNDDMGTRLYSARWRFLPFSAESTPRIVRTSGLDQRGLVSSVRNVRLAVGTRSGGK